MSRMAIIVTGASGFIGSAVCRRLAAHKAVHGAFASHPERLPADLPLLEPCQIDLEAPASLAAIIRDIQPAAVVHLGAMSALGACEHDPKRAARVNVDATEAIAEACAAVDAILLFASTDQVFDGEHAPYAEADAANPLHVYGRTKLQAESHVSGLGTRGLSLRISLTYGDSPTGDRSASEQIIHSLSCGKSPRLFTDEMRSPIFVADVAHAIDEIVMRMLEGDAIVPEAGPRVLHLGGPERFSRTAFGERVAQAFGFDTASILAVTQRDVALGYDRPRDVSLDSSLARRVLETKIRSVDDGLSTMHQSAARRHCHG